MYLLTITPDLETLIAGCSLLISCVIMWIVVIRHEIKNRKKQKQFHEKFTGNITTGDEMGYGEETTPINFHATHEQPICQN